MEGAAQEESSLISKKQEVGMLTAAERAVENCCRGVAEALGEQSSEARGPRGPEGGLVLNVTALRSPSRGRPGVNRVRLKKDDAGKDVNHPWKKSLSSQRDLTRRGQPRHGARLTPRRIRIKKRSTSIKLQQQQTTFCSAASSSQLHKSESSSFLLGSVGPQRSPPSSPPAAAAPAGAYSSLRISAAV